MLKKYNKFKEDFLLENINESVIYFSPNFRKLLSGIEDNDIAKDLLKIEVTDIKPDITFIDLDTEKDDYLSFTTMRNAIKLIDGRYPSLKSIENEPNEKDGFDKESRILLINQMYDHHYLSDIFKKSRNPLRIGKFVNKVLGNNKYNSTQVEEFVNKLRASKEKSGERFLIVEGDDIAFWYKSENYAEIKGQLGNSCMREKPSSFFEIYVKNPEVCRMLVLLEDDQLIGRALIWKLSHVKSNGKKLEGVIYFMDRQYTIKESDVDKFRSYAIENGWVYKSSNNHYTLDKITYKNEILSCSMVVNIKDLSYNKYPYMDTFKRYDPDSYRLFNDSEDSDDYEGHYILEDTDGSYREAEGGLWSEWHDRMIPEDYAVWSEWAQSYLDFEYSIRVEIGSQVNHGWYPDNCNDIVFDNIIGEYIHIDDSVYSDNYKGFILGEKAVQAIDDVNPDGEPIIYDDNWFNEDDDDIVSGSGSKAWFKRLSDKFSNWSEYPINKDLLIKDYNGDYILKYFSVIVYKVKPKGEPNVDISGITDYLSEIDARLLGYDLENGSEIVMDEFEYHENLGAIIPKIYKFLLSEKKRLDSELQADDQERTEFHKIKLRSVLVKRISNLEDGLYVDVDLE